MSGRDTDFTSQPRPSGPFEERFVYRLTDEGKKAIEESRPPERSPRRSRLMHLTGSTIRPVEAPGYAVTRAWS